MLGSTGSLISSHITEIRDFDQKIKSCPVFWFIHQVDGIDDLLKINLYEEEL